ncbi:flavin containing amine oxidoreductase [Nitzschia inconspicua]|uniref:Flavin containing amine oxidoreductase n=1 Tax=Nitzschia inconspicua TaxID=303405 RepID=A0A9K3M5X8_9STRA|nr:flavin containing amine oxidoreductase [Nitzschia inconspicua]
MMVLNRILSVITTIAVIFFATSIDANGCGIATSKGTNEFDPLDVLVIGAGWSGLAAANKLHSVHSIKHFCVLEARDAIGGRSRTKMGALEPDLSTELGSAWVWEDTIITRIFKDAGLVSNEAPSYFSFSNMGLYYEPYGGLIENESEDGIWLRQEYEAFEDYAKQYATHDVTMQQILAWYMEDYPELDEVAKQAIKGIVCGTIHSEYGSYFRDADSEYLDGHLMPEFRIDFVAVPNGGFSRALEYFAAPFADHIQVNKQVLEVDYSATNRNEVVRVSALDRSTNETMTYYTRAVVCTVSLGVLKSGDLRFTPLLPPRKEKAIKEMGMGNINKCILYWDEETKDVSWWPSDKLELQLITEEDEDSMEWTYFINDQNHNGNRKNHIMTAWIGGAKADYWETKTDAETVEHVMKNIRRMFPPPINVPEPTNYLITRWKSDPFTRGTYHYHRAGVDTYANQDIMAEPVASKVFFAGEATNEGMSAPNAYESGERAVDDIMESNVLNSIFSIFPNRRPTCSRAAHRCQTDDDCCEGYTCQHRTAWGTIKRCASSLPGVWSIEAGGFGARPRTSPFRNKDY